MAERGGLVLQQDPGLAELGKCLEYRVEEPYIVVRNSCSVPIDVEAVEVHYHITVHRHGLPEEAVLHGRREIKERIMVGRRLSPGYVVDIYFGPTGHITSVYVIVKVDGKEYRVEPRRMAEE